MKALTIIEGFSKSMVSDYIINALHSLDLEEDLQYIKSSEANHIKYAVINSKKSFYNRELYADYCFINMDNKLNKKINIFGNIITYGFGNKNTITVSSRQDNSAFVYCLQRYIKLSSGGFLEPQEIPVHIDFKDEIELYAFMVVITIALIEGLDSSEVEKKLNKKVLIF